MVNSLQYITDGMGRQQGVMMSLKDWKTVEKRLRASEQREKLKKDITEALEEVKLIRSGKLKAKSIHQILDEL